MHQEESQKSPDKSMPARPAPGGIERPPAADAWGSIDRPVAAGSVGPAQKSRRTEPVTAARDAKETLRARAKVLARERVVGDAGGNLEVVEFLLAHERYALASTDVREVYPLKDLTPLPCTPEFVLGIVNVRGQIVTVIDLRKFFDLPIKGITDLNKIIILQSADMQVGILADSISGIRSTALRTFQATLPTLTGVRADYLRGVTDQRVVVLDTARILSDERIIVHQEVEA